MSTIGADGSGYLADPSPVHRAPSAADRTMVFSGTTKAVLQCPLPVVPGCFVATRITIDAGGLRDRIAAAGATVTNFQNVDLFQDDAGGWHAAVTIGVHSAAHPDHWTVIAHAHPQGPTAIGSSASSGSPAASPTSTPSASPPLAWSADTLLSGSFAEAVDGNYDGKYFVDDGRLYLLYVKNFAAKPALRNGIVIQPMTSPTEPAVGGPTTLLTPGDRYGELDAEWYANTKAKPVEAPFLAKIDGKYALIYSAGAYRAIDYKAGVAWSDHLTPTPNGRYRKVREADPRGVWGTTGHPEVRYLLQSQRPRWPHFTGAQVISPGVASAVRSPDATWRLFFAGFDPSDRPVVGPGVADPTHRRPFFVTLHGAVPTDRPVASVSDEELATWLEPQTRRARPTIVRP